VWSISARWHDCQPFSGAWCRSSGASDPLTRDELRELGVFWLDDSPQVSGMRRVPGGGGTMPYVTRLHLRYDPAHFPENLVFQQTSDRSNFQGRYILRHLWTGADAAARRS
jgi:hypothetical protein